MNKEPSTSEQAQPGRISRLFNVAASLGIFYTVFDVTATIANNIHTATTGGVVGLSANDIMVFSATGAAVGALVMDRIYQHHSHLEESGQVENQPVTEEPE